jgi:hypothetical protein
MKRIIVAMALVLMLAPDADAGPLRRLFHRGGRCGYSCASNSCASCEASQNAAVPCATCPGGYRIVAANESQQVPLPAPAPSTQRMPPGPGG